MWNTGNLSLTNDTLSGNSAGRGGGVYNDGTSTLTNGTLSGNSAGYGGGVFNYGTATLTNDTLSGNSAGFGGGVYNDRHPDAHQRHPLRKLGPSPAAASTTTVRRR